VETGSTCVDKPQETDRTELGSHHGQSRFPLLKRAREFGGSQTRFAMSSTGYPTYLASRLSWTATLSSRDKQSHISCPSKPSLHFNLRPDSGLSHYQVIMMTEIFQYSNMYTLRRSIQWLADEPNVYEECGPYVTLPGAPSLSRTLSHRLTWFPHLGRQVPDWPRLLHLYSRMKSGKTVLEWMQEYQVEQCGIDVRRFTSFGVIKVVEESCCDGQGYSTLH